LGDVLPFFRTTFGGLAARVQGGFWEAFEARLRHRHRCPLEDNYWGSFRRHRLGEVCLRLDNGFVGEDEAASQDHHHASQWGFIIHVCYSYSKYFDDFV